MHDNINIFKIKAVGWVGHMSPDRIHKDRSYTKRNLTHFCSDIQPFYENV